MLANVGLAIMLSIGPVFILLAIWPATQKYMQAWLGAAIGFILTKVLITAICTVIPTIFEQIINSSMKGMQDKTLSPVGLSMTVLVVAFSLGFAALHASSLGAQLAGGGASMDSKGVGGMITQLLVAKMFSKNNTDTDKDKNKETDAEQKNSASDKPTLGARAGFAAGRTTGNILNALGRKRS